MNDPVPVSRFHRFGDLSRDVAGLVDWYRTFEQSIRQRRTVHEFHDQRVMPPARSSPWIAAMFG